uniref:Polyamine aminopropyltransferase n=1 Tax=candidate division WOR-3 bacterium TaxID=2052148 RepID=A0A7C3UNU5_UNCW3
MDWFTERQSKGLSLSIGLKKKLFEGNSKFQKISVFDTIEFGRMLTLDDKVMLTERDEFIYHEMIVHPIFQMLKKCENVLVIGGGDGGTVREILRYKDVKKIYLVEIDEMVIEVSKKYFPNLGKYLNNKKVEIKIMDGAEFVSKTNENFDVVIVDSTDPVGPGEILFSDKFLKDVSRISRNIVSQTESPFLLKDFIKGYHRKLRKYFKRLFYYIVPIPTYPSGTWSFTIGTNENLKLKGKIELKYYTPEIFKSSLSIPPFYRT